MTFYSSTKRIYKAVLPNPVRKAIYRSLPMPLKLARAYIIRQLQKSATLDEIYDERYYTDALDARLEKSFQVIAKSIVTVFSPKSVVDVGCGPGVLLLALKRQGVVCRGLEYSSTALNMCHQKGLDVTRFDIEHDILPKDFKADVVVSTETAEHLPEYCADRFVGTLCAIADNVVMTAAGPLFLGNSSHVNEQPKEYWIDKFANKGFKHNEGISAQFRTEWKEADVCPWFVQNLMVFRK